MNSTATEEIYGWLLTDKNETSAENLCQVELNNHNTMFVEEPQTGNFLKKRRYSAWFMKKGHVGLNKVYNLLHMEDISYQMTLTRTWSAKNCYWFSRSKGYYAYEEKSIATVKVQITAPSQCKQS